MINFKFGSLTIFPALERQDLLASKVAEALVSLPNASEIGIAEIDPTLSDTAAFCAHYGVALDSAANCVVLEAARGGSLMVCRLSGFRNDSSRRESSRT